MKNIALYIVLIFFVSCNSTIEKKETDQNKNKVSNTFLERVEPPNWWVNMKNSNLQLLVHHPNISEYEPEINYVGVSIKKTTESTKSNNYLFIDLEVAEGTKAGKFDILFKKENSKTLTHTYQLKPREKLAEDYEGFDSSDAIYLITPDRFSNANETNDINKDLKETTIDRTHGYKRHGGDLQGIIKGVDYIYSLGFTAIWSTPVLMNDMPRGSYHGYAMTDYYQVDPRFGTMDDYKNLSRKLNSKGMKLIMDQVANHCGLEHWWMKDLPFDDWINNQSYYEKNKENWSWKTVKHSNHRRTTNQDLYASKSDRKGNTDGWFVSDMPDLNQRNSFMATYIIQNSIWWIETLDLGGIRQDTYPYPDKNFMSNWAGAIMKEYPNFSIVGEEWSYNPLLVGYWQTGSKNKDGYDSNLKSTMDFPMSKAIIEGINEKESWDKGLIKLYEGLANDFHYAKPKDVMIFLDNHDKSRLFTEMKEDAIKAKMALSYMMALPRILQMYYGTEILMDDTANPGDHGLIRTDFPGGWKDDKVNAFTGEGLSIQQKDMQEFTRKLLNYRKTSKAIQEGKTTHFAPKDGIYFLFRKYKEEIVVLILNKNVKPVNVDLSRFKEMNLNGKEFKNIFTDKTIIWKDSLELKEKGSLLLTTKK